VANRALLHTLTIPGPLVHALAFSPDGTTLATDNWDGHEQLWDLRTGTPRGAPWVAQAAGQVATTSFSRDGRMLVTSGLGPTELWDASTGKQISALPTRQAKTGAVAAFDPTGHTLVTASRDGTVQLWDVDPTSWHNRACALAGRRLTEQEWNDSSQAAPTSPPADPPDILPRDLVEAAGGCGAASSLSGSIQEASGGGGRGQKLRPGCPESTVCATQAAVLVQVTAPGGPGRLVQLKCCLP
jgi:dipeptidyl aminopeptidase/acylaminoacyl peptidase